jgi:hypothetical protein
LWSPQGTLQFVRQTVAGLTPEAAATIPEFPATAPVGFAVTAAPGRFDGELAVPGEILQAVAQLIQRLRAGLPAARADL